MRNIFKDKIFWFFFLSITFFVGMFSLNHSRTYQAKTKILFLPKNEIAIRNIDQILENSKQIPLSLSFYDKIIDLNSGIEDGASELAAFERKEFWNAKIETERIEKSGVLEMTVFDDNEAQAEIILKQSTAGILTVMKSYYGIQNLDIRIIDGPIIKYGQRINYKEIGSISLFGGIVGGYLFSLLINFILQIKEDQFIRVALKKTKEAVFSSSVKFSFPEIKKEEVVTDSLKPVKNIFDFKVEDEEALVAPAKWNIFAKNEKKSSAPSNLPVADDLMDNFFQSETTGQKEVVQKISDADLDKSGDKNEFVLDMGGKKNENGDFDKLRIEKNEDFKREATPEEVKERLNKLLSGNFSK